MAAQRINNYGDNAQYKNALEDVVGIMDKVDLAVPDENIISPETSTMQLLKIQAQVQSDTIGQCLEYIRNFVPLKEDQLDSAQLFAPNAGDKCSVQAQQDYLEDLAKKNYLVTRMVQERHYQRDAKAAGSYIDSERDPICLIPSSVAQGTVTQVGDSALKLLPTFSGDTSQEAENLKTFLVAIYDVAITNRLTETCIKAVLKRKLGGTARRLIDSYEQEFADVDRPNLKEAVLKLEDRFMSDWQPELANAKLSMYSKSPNQTYQKLEGDISELAMLAARGEKPENRQSWMKHRKAAVFKQAVTEEDRQLIYRENQSRNIAGIQEMNLSQMVDYLIKIYSETNAFTQANMLKNNSCRNSNIESIQTATEKDSKNQKRKKKKEVAKAKQMVEEQKRKEEILAIYEQNKFFQPNKGGGRGGRGNGNGRNYNNQGNQPFNKGRGGKGNSFNPNKGGASTPRKFVTPEMVNVNPNSCLKCNSPTHRFQESDKCIYGKGTLMTKACPNCREGGHHSNICIKNQKPTLGAPEPQGQEMGDKKFSKWPEATKNIPDQDYSKFLNPKNDWLPSLFPK